MASRLDSPFDLERCGPAVDLALDKINKKFLAHHNVELQKVQGSYPTCSGAIAPGLAADMHFKDDVIAFVGPACAFALEPVARLAAYWNTPIITGMGDQDVVAVDTGLSPLFLGKENWRKPKVLSNSDRVAVWKSKELHGRFYEALSGPDVDQIASVSWLQFGDLFGQTEGFVCAIMDEVIKTRNYRKHIMKDGTLDIC
ncbi:jg5939 [Pararge aegeria aegeria]|uniref:Jg5939 protein n=1 Tax=Pararge aegeria aegeria TaxID=348720 RepID=A0A8S4RDJ1_9NEOP|nr:jg5939 [Pararge aegeria aegeria]